MKSRHSLINRLMSRFSYSEKFIFISILFACSFITLAGFMVYEQEQSIMFLNIELEGTKYFNPLRKLLEHIPRHNLLTHIHQKDDKETSTELISLESLISEDLKQLNSVDEELKKTLKTDENQIRIEEEKQFTPQEMPRLWVIIKAQPSGSPEISDTFHFQLMTSIRGLMLWIGDTSHLTTNPSLGTSYLINIILKTLPELQQRIWETLLIGERMIKEHKPQQENQAKMIGLISLIDKDIASIKRSASIAILNDLSLAKNDLKITLEPLIIALLKQHRDFIDFVEEKFIRASEITTSTNDFFSSGQPFLDISFKLWDVTAAQLNAQLEIEKGIENRRQILSLTIASSLALIGFIVGIFIMRQISIPLNHLTNVTRRLAGGDLSARVPIYYQDEIGRVGIAFNNMAQSFQVIIGQLRELLEAIKRLADGDFSARVSVTNPNDEVGKVSLTFNNMAQTFEDIIGQLHHLGINLTTSATEIATASKQQETIIMEQEATTRQISVTANEISTTAKEFANTVHEVSKVVEYTAGLAAGGRESLSHMENIMRQMVDASGSIASKLAILNEKAGNITTVITTITKVADQTNLLSLNASIEAEKAGEFGRSFSVIAKEIRRLADQTAYATLDIEKIVNEIMNALSSSVMGVEDFTQEIQVGVEQASKVEGQLSKIIEQVQTLTERFESVNQGMQTQSAGAEQINEAILQLSHTAQQTTESIHQFRNTIQQLNSAATDLRVAVSKIKR